MTTNARIVRFLTTLTLLAGSAAAHAGGVVGNGSPGSCTPAALTQALAGGGTVTFACGPDPQTIILPQRLTIAADTTIAGEDRIILSGGGAHGHFTVQTGRTLTLDRVTVRDGGAENWAVWVADSATLRMVGVTVRDCARGGVYNAGGTVAVSDSIFADIDAGSSGAAITNEGGGELTVQRSAFERNLNGAIFSVGPTTISDSAFTSNHGDSAGGGAINHTKTLRVSRCRFDDNQAAAGGAIYTAGDLTVEDSIFHRNQATVFEGGGIQLFNQTQSPSSVTVRASTFEENVATRGGGAVRCDAPNGVCTLENVTFSRNVAMQTGGGTELSVKNGAVVVTHATVMAGGSPAIERAGGSLTLRNSIVTDGGCTVGVTDGGGNVQDQPGLCAAGFHDGDPALFALADNGGATPTHEIRAGSAARGIATTNCLPTDQRGVARPTTGCDAGAFHWIADIGLHARHGVGHFGDRVVLLEVVDFLAQLGKFAFARHLVEAAAEFPGHGAGLAGPFARHVHQARQILRPHHDKGDDEHDAQMLPAEKVEHGLLRVRPWSCPCWCPRR